MSQFSPGPHQTGLSLCPAEKGIETIVSLNCPWIAGVRRLSLCPAEKGIETHQ